MEKKTAVIFLALVVPVNAFAMGEGAIPGATLPRPAYVVPPDHLRGPDEEGNAMVRGRRMVEHRPVEDLGGPSVKLCVTPRATPACAESLQEKISRLKLALAEDCDEPLKKAAWLEQQLHETETLRAVLQNQ